MIELNIKDLHVEVEGTEILKGIDLEVRNNEVVVLMGPNGSGKSTLANTLMGHPNYKVTKGTIRLNGVEITNLSPDGRAKLGLFLSFQYPQEIQGVSIANFLRTSMQAIKNEKIDVLKFRTLLNEKLELLGIDKSFANRNLNEGFSGGEKKKSEILQLSVLKPKVAILDETDSGLDIDALKIVASGVSRLVGKEMGVLLITHYKRILKYVKPTKVHILIDGKIVRSGDPSLINDLEDRGYGWLKEKEVLVNG
jgi:Fe-S cluster assembly ATP-binding protein